MGSTVKSVFLFAACLFDMSKSLYMAESRLTTLHQTLQALHKTHGVLTIACEPLNANHNHSSANHNNIY